MDVSEPPAGAEGGRPGVAIAVPEIRDYHEINKEIVRHLDEGRRTIRLSSVRGQRLLAAGLRGGWSATIEIEGDAGPELAAGLDAPGLTVIGLGSAADGAASGLRAGTLVILGRVGPALGYAMRGGLVVAAGSVGPRAGLGQSGGEIVVFGEAGPMAAERQSGGRFLIARGRLGPHPGFGRRGGERIEVAADDLFRLEILDSVREWLGPALPVIDSSAGEVRA